MIKVLFGTHEAHSAPKGIYPVELMPQEQETKQKQEPLIFFLFCGKKKEKKIQLMQKEQQKNAYFRNL